MKKIKKIVVLALACAMLFGMTLAAHAASSTDYYCPYTNGSHPTKIFNGTFYQCPACGHTFYNGISHL